MATQRAPVVAVAQTKRALAEVLPKPIHQIFLNNCPLTSNVTAGTLSYTTTTTTITDYESVAAAQCQHSVATIHHSATAYQVHPASLFISENFNIKCHTSFFQAERLVHDRLSNGCIVMEFTQTRAFKSMKLTKEADCIQYTPNAGGSSVESETLSFEILKKLYNARLRFTEEEVAYFPFGGSKTDYVVHLFDSVIGVSVTRAFKFTNEPYSFDDAFLLLNKKLKGIIQSTKNTMVRWEKQILHVWVLDEQAAVALLTVWDHLDAGLKSNTVLLITLASRSRELFTNPPKKTRQRPVKLRSQMSKTVINVHI